MKPVRADVCFVKERSDSQKEEGKKRAWPVVGTAFFNDNGTITVKLDSIPINWNGELVIFQPKENYC